MDHVAPIILAIVALMGALGATGKFIWNKIAARLDAIDLKLEQCETREKESLERRAILLATIELLWAELKRVQPRSAVLERAKKLMDDLKAKQAD